MDNNVLYKNQYTKEQWIEHGRKDTLQLILTEEYGVRPPEADIPCSYRVVEEKCINNIRIQKIQATFMTMEMLFFLYQPNDDKAHPCFVLNMHEYAEEQSGDDFVNHYQNITLAPIDNIIGRGYSLAISLNSRIARDGYDFKIRTKRDVFAEINKVRYGNDWGTLNAWSWGMSKVVDYLVTLPTIDKNRLAAIGHSRGGKTALLAAVQDDRFLLTIASGSGQSGVALSKGKPDTAESVGVITTLASYWFAPNFFKYAKHEEDLPFDQHQLLGLLAPRYLFISCGVDDLWACPDSELLSAKYASQYFELFGVDGLIVPEQLELNKTYGDGHIAYRIREGGHKLREDDWEEVMNYFDSIK